jgi:hypothetical protein
MKPRFAASTRETARGSTRGEHCPHCDHVLSDEWIKAAHSRVAGRIGGRPRVLRPCLFCKKKFGARELRGHIPRCDKAPGRGLLRSQQHPVESSNPE